MGHTAHTSEMFILLSSILRDKCDEVWTIHCPNLSTVYHELEVMECTDNCLHQKGISTAHEIKMV